MRNSYLTTAIRKYKMLTSQMSVNYYPVCTMQLAWQALVERSKSYAITIYTLEPAW